MCNNEGVALGWANRAPSGQMRCSQGLLLWRTRNACHDVLISSLISCFCLCLTHGFGDDVLFRNDFKRGLSDKWQAVGMKESDYRVRDGGVEIAYIRAN